MVWQSDSSTGYLRVVWDPSVSWLWTLSGPLWCVWLWSERLSALISVRDDPAGADTAEQTSSETPAASLKHTHTQSHVTLTLH